MSAPRQMPSLGQPSRTLPTHRSEPQLPSAPAPIPARGPYLGTSVAAPRSR